MRIALQGNLTGIAGGIRGSLAEALDSGAVVVAIDRMLALPDTAAPNALIYRADRTWVAEHGGVSAPIADGDELDRVRRQLAKLGVANAALVVERRRWRMGPPTSCRGTSSGQRCALSCRNDVKLQVDREIWHEVFSAARRSDEDRVGLGDELIEAIDKSLETILLSPQTCRYGPESSRPVHRSNAT